MRGAAWRRGRVVVWNDTGGYGFIGETSDAVRVFMHISSLSPGMRRPAPGDAVEFRMGTGRAGRPAAQDVRLIDTAVEKAEVAERYTHDMPRHIGVRLVAVLLMVFLLGAGTVIGHVPPLLDAVYAGMGMVSAATYWVDKRAAERGEWRIAERTLHAVDFCFGIVGGLGSQVLFRHKSRKPSYAAVSAGIAAMHLGAMIFLVVR